MLGLTGGVAIVVVAYSVNAWFNHTAIGLDLKSRGDAYVIGFFLSVGVILPALFLGWVVRIGWATRRAGSERSLAGGTSAPPRRH
jgi:hypothetical protein